MRNSLIMFDDSKSVRLASVVRLAGWLITLASLPSLAQAQSTTSLLLSRADLTAAASRAEVAATSGDPAYRTESAMIAAAMRQRLRDGDFQVGDRVIVTIVSDVAHRDTAVVRPDLTIELQEVIVVPVAGVLRSELRERVSAEVLKYIKAQQIEVTPLMRVAILGAVAKPGYFAFASDMPVSDAIMAAGGPAANADVQRSIVIRANHQYKSSSEISKAISDGLTLDQFGLTAGDEIVVGQRHDLGATLLVGLGAMASILTLIVALQH
jgi:protein involved in polysaccharide export with SLBB domain